MTGPVNLKALRYCHGQLVANLTRAVNETLTEAGQFGKYRVQHYGWKRSTGALASKTEARVIRTNSGALLRLRNTSPYARAQDLGSGLHASRGTRAKYQIVPRRAKFLRFVVSGRTVFARKVMHPGVRPTRFLFLATEAAGAHEKNLLTTEMGRVARRFNKARV